MQKIGTIEFVQIQQNSLKTHVSHEKTLYDPGGIMMLQEIRLTTFGIVGILDFLNKEMAYLDIHHLHHPQSRFRGDNKISMGFTGHYERMRAEFGIHLREGSAGENIIVKIDHVITPQELGQRLAIRSRIDDSLIYLSDVKPIPPCESFVRYARNRGSFSPRETQTDLQLLSGGLRGYYMEVDAAAEEAIVRIGDTVYRADER